MARSVSLFRFVKIGLLSIAGGVILDGLVFGVGSYLRTLSAVHRRALSPASTTIVPTPTGISVAPVMAEREIVARGRVNYDRTHYAHVASRTSGLVSRVLQGTGSQVRRGDLLALIDAGDIGKMKADFLLSLAQFELADMNLTHLEEVAALLPERDLRSARGKQREARIRMFNDRQALLNVGFSIRFAELESLSDVERIRYIRLLGLPREMREATDADELTANLVPLVAPITGKVVRCDVVEGQAINVSQARTLFVVADTKKLQLDLDVEAKDAARIELGSTVTFRADIGAAEAIAIVNRVDPEIDAVTQRVRVVAGISSDDDHLQPYGAGTGRIAVPEPN